MINLPYLFSIAMTTMNSHHSLLFHLTMIAVVIFDDREFFLFLVSNKAANLILVQAEITASQLLFGRFLSLPFPFSLTITMK